MPSVLITGAGRGLGRAAALRLARAGWDVHAGVRDEAAGEALAREAPGRVTPVVLDVTDDAQVAALRETLPERLDGLVNNAGTAVGGPVEGIPLDALRDQLEVNVVGMVAVTQAVLPKLRAGGGRVVLVSSVSGRVSSPMLGAYSASKFAVEALGDALRIELRPWRIPVSLVEPGSFDTDIWRNATAEIDAADARMAPEHRALYAKHTAGMRKVVPRIQKAAGDPEDVAAAVEAALTDRRPKARYLVGKDARAQVLLRALLPARAFDAVIARATGGR